MQASALLGITYDVHDSDLPRIEGYSGRDIVETLPSLGASFAWDLVDFADRRREGFLLEIKTEGHLPLRGAIDPFVTFAFESQGHAVFAADWLNFSTRIRLESFSSDLAAYQVNRSNIPRGGRAAEFWSPLVFGFNLEFRVSPVRTNWLFLELVGICDMAWGGESFSEAFSTPPMYRIGPGRGFRSLL